MAFITGEREGSAPLDDLLRDPAAFTAQLDIGEEFLGRSDAGNSPS